MIKRNSIEWFRGPEIGLRRSHYRNEKPLALHRPGSSVFCINHLKSFQRRAGQKDTSLDKNEQRAAADTSQFSFAKISRAKNSVFVTRKVAGQVTTSKEFRGPKIRLMCERHCAKS